MIIIIIPSVSFGDSATFPFLALALFVFVAVAETCRLLAFFFGVLVGGC
jgi:hypothetical protein